MASVDMMIKSVSTCDSDESAEWRPKGTLPFTVMCHLLVLFILTLPLYLAMSLCVQTSTYQTNMKHINANLVNLLEGTTRCLFMSTTRPDLPLCSPKGMHFCLFHTELLNIEPRGSHQAVVKLFNKLIQLFQAFISC